MKLNIELNTESNTAIVFRDDKGIKSEFAVTVSDLIDSLKVSKTSDEAFKTVFSPIQQRVSGYELIQTIQIAKKAFYYVFKADKKRVPFFIYDKCYGMCGMPSLLIAIKVVNNKFNKMYLQAIKENTIIDEDSKLYIYPFSNTSSTIGAVCLGSNRFEEDMDTVEKMRRFIDYFYEIPNTSEMFRILNNSKALEFRALAAELKNKDFNDNFLIENTQTKNYQSWILKLIKLG